MRKNGKKLLAVILTAIMVLSAAPLSALTNLAATAEAATSGIFTYNVYTDGDGEYAEIGDCDTSASGAIEIPSEIDGYPVKEIGYSAFYNCDSITSIVIPDSVTEISNYAFESCNALESVEIPDSVTYIGSSAFYNCTALKSIVIPDSITAISSSTFYNCTALESVSVPDSVTSIGSNVFYGCSSLTSLSVPASVSDINPKAFDNCPNLTLSIDAANEYYTVENGVLFNKAKTALIRYPASSSATSYSVPDTVTTISEYAFYDCNSLVSVTLPDGLKWIEDYAFYSCDSLASVNLPDGLVSIGEYAFAYCYLLTSVTLPDSLVSISYGAFYNCDSLTSISLPGSLKSVGSDAFGYCETLTDIEIAEGVEGIENDAFYGSAYYNNSDNWTDYALYIDNCLIRYNGSAESYEIPDGTRLIADGVFSNSGISSVTLPDSITSIGSHAFFDCNNLTSVTFGNNLKSIGDYAFSDCNSLTSISLPESVESIGQYAFAYCDNLTSITIPGSTALGYGVFNGCSNLATIEIGEGVTGLTNSDIEDTAYYQNEENWENGEALYLGTALVKVSQDFEGEFVVKPGTTEIAENAFAFCSGLTAITLPESLTTIGDSAFIMCYNLTSITLPAACQNIGDSAFMLCYKLESVNAPYLTVIPDSAFAGCLALKQAPISALTTEIGEGAFMFCTSITNIHIPASVGNNISPDAFIGCTGVTEYSVDADHEYLTTDGNGVLYTKEMEALVAYPSASAMTEYAIPEGVEVMLPIISAVNLETLSLPSTLLTDNECLEMLALTAIGMKVDANSLLAALGEHTDTIVEFFLTLAGESSADAISGLIDSLIDYINKTESKEALVADIESLCSDLIGAAELTAFKGFEVAEDHPVLSSKDGALYVTAETDEGTTKTLVSVPCTVTGKYTIEKDTDYILPSAFAFCSPAEIVIPESIKGLAEYTFILCEAESVTIPASVEEIASGAFALSFISTIEFEDRDTLPSEGRYPFMLCFADEIILPDSVTEIPEMYFYICMAKEITLPEKLTTISESAFSLALLLGSIDIPDSVTIIGEFAFGGCISLSEVNFSEYSKLEHIGDSAFAVTNIENFKIPANVSHIGHLALNPTLAAYIESVMDAAAPYIDEFLAEAAEYGIELDSETVYSTVEHVLSWFNKNTGVEVDSRNRYFSEENGNLYNYDKTKLIDVAETATGIFEIPSSVLTIGQNAFACTGVTEIVIPDTVKTIDSDAFEMATKLKSVSIGSGVKTISSSTFNNCMNLERVVILPSVVSISEDAFDNCSDNLTIVGYAGSYAYTYAVENEIPFESIDGSTYVSIIAPTEVAGATVPVYGHTLANTKVEIYDGTTKIGEITSGSTGFWRTEVTLTGTTDNSVHTLTAKVFAGTDKQAVSEPVEVTFTTTSPVFESITLYHNNYSRTITFDTIYDTPSAVSFSSYSPFTYEIELSVYDGTKTLYVVSGEHKMPATYDAKTGKYIAHGYFDYEGSSYVPEYVTLELGGCTLANTSFRFPFIIDPSGFVYEAVESNRIEGATASIFYKDENGLSSLWNDAPIYDQSSTIITGADGVFKWDVPAGDWQVKVEKEGYETAYSDWLPVPPPQLEVYIGIISKLSPSVKYLNAYYDSIDVTFTQYMDINTVNSTNVSVVDSEGNTVYGSWSAVNSEYAGDGSGNCYATTFRFAPYSTLSGNYTVNVSTDVTNYAGKTMSDPFSQNITVKAKVQTLSIPDSLSLEYGKEYSDGSNSITIDGSSAAAGMKVNITMSNGYTVTQLNTVTLDENGQAVVSVSAAKPGKVTINFSLEGTELTESIEVSVAMPGETKVTGIDISDKAATLEIGAKKQLFAYVAPDFATNTEVKWSSNNASVVSVDSEGLITALKDGTATITVKTIDGGFTASCKVTVIAQEYTVNWNIDGNVTTQKYAPGAKITAPAAPAKEGYTFVGWTPSVPATMPTKNLSFTAVYSKNETPADPPAATPTVDIRTPSLETINYGDSIDLHADVYLESVPVGTLSEGMKIVWTADNENFAMSVSEDGKTCTISPESSGDTTFTATIVDAEGNEISSDTQKMTSKAGFFQKIIAFFKKLFGLTKHYANFFVKVY